MSHELKRNQEKLVFFTTEGAEEGKKERKKGDSYSSDPECWDILLQKLTVLRKQDTKDTWQG